MKAKEEANEAKPRKVRITFTATIHPDGNTGRRVSQMGVKDDLKVAIEHGITSIANPRSIEIEELERD